MALYLYGVVGASSQPPAGEGVGGGAVKLVDHGDIAALVSEIPDTDLKAKKRDLLAHSDVLQRACAAGVDILPVRFGTAFSDEDELRRVLLDPNGATFVAMLGGVAGKVEIQVKGSYIEEAIAAEIVASDRRIQRLKGSQSLDAQVELGRRFAEGLEKMRYGDGRRIIDTLAGAAQHVSIGDVQGEYGVVNASFLVDRSAIDRFDEVFAGLASELDARITLRSVGPLPAYSFVDASALVVGPWA